MKITLDIDEETEARVSKIAAARDLTVEAMVTEYLMGIAGSHADSLERKVQADIFRETVTKYSRDMGTRTWTRDNLYG